MLNLDRKFIQRYFFNYYPVGKCCCLNLNQMDIKEP